MIVEGDKLKVTLTAAAAITAGNVVYISGAKEVSPCNAANASKVLGVADANAAVGDNVEVVICGLADVIASGAISIGDKVVAADAAKVTSENSITPTFSGNAVADHTHGNTFSADALTGADLAATQADHAVAARHTLTNAAGGSHTPAGTISSVGHGRVLGKALQAASIDGDTITVLVCLA